MDPWPCVLISEWGFLSHLPQLVGKPVPGQVEQLHRLQKAGILCPAMNDNRALARFHFHWPVAYPLVCWAHQGGGAGRDQVLRKG